MALPGMEIHPDVQRLSDAQSRYRRARALKLHWTVIRDAIRDMELAREALDDDDQ